ncbi:hypothetical protein LCGC14_1972020 [marine sediment metagenome]|uniref:Uncharacterized protein n=1 Tax=marine sediment metagenome TaxID=412755 RepID=A0A0F9I8G8_9ZZZZ
MMIKNLNPALAERGKIKIGLKGELRKSGRGNDYQLPKKLDHFRVVTMEKGADNNFIVDREIHAKEMYGLTPKELAVRLLYDDIESNMQTRYACYKGRQQWCTGDGEKAIRVRQDGGGRGEVECPCERQAPDYKGEDKCKMNGALSVIIDGVEVVGGVWKFRTTSYNTIMGVLGGLALIKKVTGGPLAGIPLRMKISPKTVVSPADNKVQTVQVVSLEYKGSPESLQELGYQKALQQEKHSQRMGNIEQEVKRITATATDIVDEDVVDEFYPEQAMSDFDIPIMESPVDPKVVFAKDLKDVNFNTFVEQAAKANEVDFDGALLEASKNPDSFRGSFRKWQAQQKEIEIQLGKVAEQEAEKAIKHPGKDDPLNPETEPSDDPDDDMAMVPSGKDEPTTDTDTDENKRYANIAKQDFENEIYKQADKEDREETQTEPRPSDGMNRGDLLNRIQKFKKEKSKEYLKMFKGKKPSDGKDERLREWVDIIGSVSNDPATEEDGIPF